MTTDKPYKWYFKIDFRTEHAMVLCSPIFQGMCFEKSDVSFRVLCVCFVCMCGCMYVCMYVYIHTCMYLPVGNCVQRAGRFWR